MATPRVVLTYEDYVATPNDGRRYHGEVFLSPIAVILAQTTVVEPDLVYLDATRAAFVGDRGIEGAPTLLVEVLSPSTTKVDRGTKLQIYARYAVLFYWIVDPQARTIEVHELSEDGYSLVTTARGSDPVALPPFSTLPLVPESLWP